MWSWWYFSKRWHLIGKFASRGLTVVIQNSMAITEYLSNWRLTYLKLGGWSWWPPQCFWPLCSKRLGGGSFNLVTFNINVWSIQKSYFLLLRLSGLTMATSFSGSIPDFLKLSFHVFPYNEILKLFKSRLWLDIGNRHPKILLITKFQWNQWKGLEVTSIWSSGLWQKYRL